MVHSKLNGHSLNELTGYLRHFMAAMALSAPAFLYSSALAHGTEMLVNRSYESPALASPGNAFFASIPGWTIVPTPNVSLPVNLIRGSVSGPPNTTTGGGFQYLDINGAGGTVSQDVTFPSAGVVSMSAWFSVRDSPKNSSGLKVELFTAANVLVGSGSTFFVIADPLGLWKNASASSIPVLAGTYKFVVTMNNPNNTDLASLDFVSNFVPISSIEIDKTSNKTGPLVVGELVTYTFNIRNTGNVPLSNVNIADATNGTGTTPVPGSEVLQTDVVPLGDSTDPAIAAPASANGIWDTLGAGDTIRLTSTYVVTQQDIDALQ